MNFPLRKQIRWLLKKHGAWWISPYVPEAVEVVLRCRDCNAYDSFYTLSEYFWSTILFSRMSRCLLCYKELRYAGYGTWLTQALDVRTPFIYDPLFGSTPPRWRLV
jgi:hypothetical protein